MKHLYDNFCIDMCFNFSEASRIQIIGNYLMSSDSSSCLSKWAYHFKNTYLKGTVMERGATETFYLLVHSKNGSIELHRMCGPHQCVTIHLDSHHLFLRHVGMGLDLKRSSWDSSQHHVGFWHCRRPWHMPFSRVQGYFNKFI